MAQRNNVSSGLWNSAASDRDTLDLYSQQSYPQDDYAGLGSTNAESDVAELAAKFAEHSGGSLSPEFSANLALEIVLNEIAEQARLATRATGAAIALRRDGEMFCRASTGASAPVLGARMDANSGLSGLCIRTGQIQRSDDTLIDLRADFDASQELGVRSVMVLPLLRRTGLIGIFEVLSTDPAAFNENDERTLEALARRALRTIDRAAEPFFSPKEAPVQIHSIAVRSADTGLAEIGSNNRSDVRRELDSGMRPATTPALMSDAQLAVPTFAGLAKESRTRIDGVTWFLALAVLGGVVLLSVLTARRFAWSASTHTDQAQAASGQDLDPAAATQSNMLSNDARSIDNQRDDASIASALALNTPNNGLPGDVENVSKAVENPASSGVTRATGPKPGELRVYENGREVFRLPAEASGDDGKQEWGKRIIELPAALAAKSVIRRVEPEYPEQARLQRLQGKVELEVRIRPDGTVRNAQLTSGDPVFAQAAIDAVKQWRFKLPAAQSQLAEMQTQVTLDFRLPD